MIKSVDFTPIAVESLEGFRMRSDMQLGGDVFRVSGDGH